MRKTIISNYLQENLQKVSEKTLEFLEEEFDYAENLEELLEIYRIHNKMRVMNDKLSDIIFKLEE